MSLHYKLDIDGLRGIAVLGVIFFHMAIPGFKGGFIGVDIFFVISGFLITSIILRDIDSEMFSIIHFYKRRIRRIIPKINSHFVNNSISVIDIGLIIYCFTFYSNQTPFPGNNALAPVFGTSFIIFSGMKKSFL